MQESLTTLVVELLGAGESAAVCGGMRGALGST
jgi:hypothetical protein